MSKMNLSAKLKKHRRIGLDSMVFIYYFEDNAKYADDCQLIFERMEGGKNVGTTSLMTYLEIIGLPTKLGQDGLVSQYENIIRNFPNLLTQNLNFEILNEAARLRGEHNIHTLDAIQIATAKYFGATLFVTNDKRLQKTEAGIEVVGLDK